MSSAIEAWRALPSKSHSAVSAPAAAKRLTGQAAAAAAMSSTSPNERPSRPAR